MSGIPHFRKQIQLMERPGTSRSKAGGGNMNSDGSLKPRREKRSPKPIPPGDRYIPITRGR